MRAAPFLSACLALLACAPPPAAPNTAVAGRPPDWPRAVRVLEVVVVPGPTAYAVIESLAARDQPAGLRGVVSVAASAAKALWGPTSAAELRARLARPLPTLEWDIKQRVGRA